MLVALVLAGCQATAAVLPRLDDPKEILEEALRTTAELDFVHAEVEARVEGGLVGAEPIAGSVVGDIDLDRRDFRAVFDGEALTGSTSRIEVLLIGTQMFTRFEDEASGAAAPKWIRSTLGADSDPRAGIPPNPAIAVALKSVLEHPSLTATLEGSEACGTVQCYHVNVTIAPELIAAAMGGSLFGPGGDGEAPVDPAIPPVVLDIRIEEPTRRIVSIATNTTVAGTTVDVLAQFSKHDVHVDLVEPPVNEIDDNMGGGSGLDDLLEGVGGGLFGD